MSADVIVADGLSKQYRIGARINRYPTVRDAVADAMSRFLRARGIGESRDSERDRYWALRDVSFTIGHGEVVGVIGRNGAGKSTLLKILSRITRPTAGRAVLHGRVGSLLEVGTGFHPELTGRENVFLNGAILGMARAEIVRKLDEIVAFAEVDTFLDTPVKHYSSGMYLRLAFAVAAHLEPEILLVDEVLAVGDASFQRKCLGKMSDVARAGRTVLLVSHNLESVMRLCPRSLLIEQGRLAAFDDTSRVVGRYLAADGTKPGPNQWVDLDTVAPTRESSGLARFVSVRYTSGSDAVHGHAYPGGPLRVTMRIAAPTDVTIPSLAVTVRSQTGLRLINADTVTEAIVVPLRAGRNDVTLELDALHLNPGLYVVDLWLGDVGGAAIDRRQASFYLEVVPGTRKALGSTGRAESVVACAFRISTPVPVEAAP